MRLKRHLVLPATLSVGCIWLVGAVLWVAPDHMDSDLSKLAKASEHYADLRASTHLVKQAVYRAINQPHPNYDALNAAQRQLLSDFKRTQRATENAKTLTPQLEALLAEAALQVGRTEESVERFKSTHAAVRTSQNYLPHALASAQAKTEPGPVRDALVELSASFLARRGTTTPTATAALLVLNSTKSETRGSDAPELQQLQFQFQQANRFHEDLNRTLAALEQVDLAVPAAGSQALYQAALHERAAKLPQYRLLLMVGMAVFVTLVLLHLVISLRELQRQKRNAETSTEALAATEMRFRTLADEAPVGIVWADASGQCIYCNPAWLEISGSAPSSTRDSWTKGIELQNGQPLTEWLRAQNAPGPVEVRARMHRDNGENRIIDLRCAHIAGDANGTLIATIEDVTARIQAEQEQEQSGKLESIGRLASGIAHEINTPVQFVNDSVHFINEGLQALEKMLQLHAGQLEQIHAGALTASEAHQQAEEVADELDLEYLRENLPDSVKSSLDGLTRISTIVRSMKEFAHPDAEEKTAADLNANIASTLEIARNEYKYVADVHTEFGSDLPPVPCFRSQINQVLLNLVVNAAHAIEDRIAKGEIERGTISVVTAQDQGRACIRVSDTGCGIPEELQKKIFEPFFTTKAVGKGTGQGLSLVRKVIVDGHGGQVHVDSQPGQGTTFTISLPLMDSSFAETA